MPRTNELFIPKNIGELSDYLGMMMLDSPTFIDKTGYFPGRNLNIAFSELNGGIRLLHKNLGDELFIKLMEMSDRMRMHFESDPENNTDDTLKGRDLIVEMRNLLKQASRSSSTR